MNRNRDSLPIRLPRLLALVSCVVVCACSGGDDDAAVGAAKQVNPPPPNPYDGKPDYTNAIAQDGGQGLIAAGARFSASTVRIVARPHPALPVARVTLTTDVVGPQGVHTGLTTQGASFVVVLGVDFATNTSRIQSFLDINGDRLPDQGSKTTVATVANAHFVHSDFDRTTNRLYVLDALNRRVLLLTDSTGNGVPDSLQAADFVPASLLPGGYAPWSVEAVGGNTVRLRHYRERRAVSDPHHYVDCTDSDGNLVADTLMERAEDPQVPDGVFAFFEPPLYALDTTATIRARTGRAYRIEAEATSEELATFTANDELTTVTLNRSPAAAEDVVIIDDESEVVVGRIAAMPSTTVTVLRLDVLDGNGDRKITKIAREGGSVRFVGRNMDSGLTVEVKPVEGTTWVSCVELQSSDGELEVAVPDLADATDTTAVRCEFRVLDNGTAVAHFEKLVKE